MTGLPVLIDKGERPADQRFAARLHRRPLPAVAQQQKRRAAEGADKEAGDNHCQETAFIYSPNCTSVPFSRALPRNQLKVR